MTNANATTNCSRCDHVPDQIHSWACGIDSYARNYNSVVVTIRTYLDGDAAALANVMWRSVSVAARRDYSTDQVTAWLPGPPAAAAMHRWANDGRTVLVAQDDDDLVVGYMDLERSGHIDHLYCVPEVNGHGVASALYDSIEQLAIAKGVERLWVEASEAARRLFAKKGFILDERREWDLRGVRIHNYAMSKKL